MTGPIYFVRLQVFLGVVALGFETMQEYTHHSCNWVFVVTPPLEWNRAVTFSELFIPQGHSTRDVWICQGSDRKTETTTHTSRSCRVLAVSKRNSHGLFPLGKNRNALRAFSHLSTARSRAGSQGNTELPLNLVPSLALEIIMILMLYSQLLKRLWCTNYCAMRFTLIGSEAQNGLTGQVVSSLYRWTGLWI